MLEKITNLTIIVVALIVGITYIQTYRRQAEPPIAVVSDRLAKILPDNQASGYLVLALSTECHFCTESMPTYRAFVSSGRVNFTAIFPQTADKGSNYLTENRLVIPHIVGGLDYNELGINGTPTLVAFDSHKKFIKTWRGRLSPQQQAEVLKFIKQ